jgi:hypothetical protein
MTEKAKVEYDVNKRWEDGMEHHPKSVSLFKRIADYDFKYMNDYFCWKSGRGGNGEVLMYLLDIIFEEDDLKERQKHIGGLDG